MFNSNRYITRGVNLEVDKRLQSVMWSLIDKLNSSGKEKVDYLQVFNICKIDNKIIIEHSQEIPEYKKMYEISNMEDVEFQEDRIKLFVIDNINYSTMLLAQEY